MILYILGALNGTVALLSVPGLAHDGTATPLVAPVWLAGCALWATVFVRRSHPWAPIAAGALLAALGSEYLLLLIGIHHMMLRSDRRRTIVLGAIATGSVALFVFRAVFTTWGDELDLLMSSANSWLVSIVLAVLSLGGLFAFTAISRASHTEREQRRRAEAATGRVDALGDELARRAERERIAREIHDTLAHRLSLLSLQGGALEVAVAAGDPQAIEIARAMRAGSHDSLDDLRGLLGDLRAAPTEQTDPSTASMRSIGELVRGARAAGATVDAMILVEGVEQAATVLDRTVYRVVQEALTNAVKHSAGAPVSIYVEASPTVGVRIRVENPVREASAVAGRGSGSGTTGIRERAEQLDGQAWIGEHEGLFIVDVSFPWVRAGSGDATDLGGRS